MVKYRRGTLVFRKGELGDCAYYVAKGEIDFPEVTARCHQGEIFGEISLFSSTHVRTASAVCITDVELCRIDEQAIVTAFHQNAEFAFSLVKLVTTRLLSNIANLEAGNEQFQSVISAIDRIETLPDPNYAAR